MFTIKCTLHNGNMHIMAADSFSILKDEGGAEITLHRKTGEDERCDVRRGPISSLDAPTVYQEAIIENAMGKTTEIIRAPNPGLSRPPVYRKDAT